MKVYIHKVHAPLWVHQEHDPYTGYLHQQSFVTRYICSFIITFPSLAIFPSTNTKLRSELGYGFLWTLDCIFLLTVLRYEVHYKQVTVFSLRYPFSRQQLGNVPNQRSCFSLSHLVTRCYFSFAFLCLRAAAGDLA